MGIAFILGCTYDKTEVAVINNPDSDTTETVPYDTVDVTYNKSIKKIITTYCFSYQGNNCCHNSGGCNNQDFSTYTGITNSYYLGKMVDAVKHQGNAVPMPLGGGKIPDLEIRLIEKWMKNNHPE